MARKEKEIHSIKIMKAEDLPEAEQKKLKGHKGFVEIRVEGDPPKPRIIPMKVPPGMTLRKLFHESGIRNI